MNAACLTQTMLITALVKASHGNQAPPTRYDTSFESTTGWWVFSCSCFSSENWIINDSFARLASCKFTSSQLWSFWRWIWNGPIGRWRKTSWRGKDALRSLLPWNLWLFLFLCVYSIFLPRLSISPFLSRLRQRRAELADRSSQARKEVVSPFLVYFLWGEEEGGRGDGVAASGQWTKMLTWEKKYSCWFSRYILVRLHKFKRGLMTYSRNEATF